MEIRFKIKETDIDNRPIYIGEVPDEARGTRLVYTEKSNPETVVCKDELEAYFYVTKNMNNFLSLVQYDNKILEVEGIMPEHENNINAKLLNKAVHKVNTEINPPALNQCPYCGNKILEIDVTVPIKAKIVNGKIVPHKKYQKSINIQYEAEEAVKDPANILGICLRCMCMFNVLRIDKDGMWFIPKNYKQVKE